MTIRNAEQIKLDICDIGRRIYQRGFAAGNEGNISVRLDDNQVLCTPTMHCKGFLEPAGIATIDMQGRQLAGSKPRSSEALLHLEVYRQRPDVSAVVHCHPPHATAFAVAREPIPQCVLPEAEVFLGEVPITPYVTPGGQELADSIVPFIRQTNILILANHGTVSCGENVERAYWWTEILDNYCRILILARQLGDIRYLSCEETRALMNLKAKWGIADGRHRADIEDRQLCEHPIFGRTWQASGAEPRAFRRAATAPPDANKR
jgi:L-fuculose-phosphate aldolase